MWPFWAKITKQVLDLYFYYYFFRSYVAFLAQVWDFENFVSSQRKPEKRKRSTLAMAQANALEHDRIRSEDFP